MRKEALTILCSPTAPVTALAATVAFAVTVNAELGDPVYYEPADFAQLDIDKNGTLEPGEVQGVSPLARQRDRFDTGGDGVINTEEFSAFHAYEGPTPEVIPPIPPSPEPGPTAPPLGPDIGAPSFTELDIDRNGTLSKGEAGGPKGLLDEWWQVDQDSDNVIDRAEFTAFEVKGPSIPPE